MKKDGETQKNKGMTSTMRRVSMLVGIFMGLVMSFIFSLVGNLLSGHFTVAGWGVSFVMSLVLSIIIGVVVPMRRVGDSVCLKFKLKPNSRKGAIVCSLVSDLIYTPIITILMVIVMVGGANKGIDRMLEEDKLLLKNMIEQQQNSAGSYDISLDAGIEQLTQKIAAVDAHRPSMAKELPLSLTVCFILGFFLIMILQPIALKLAMKIHLKNKY